MFHFLFYLPVVTSLTLGIVHLLAGDSRPRMTSIGTIIFLAAAYLQFFSAHALAGMLLQTALALCLLIGRRVQG